MTQKKKALLVVSFGTSHADTREKTIDRIETRLCQAFPQRTFYRAWTSGMICRKLQKEQGICIDSVQQAMQAMADDGIQDVLVQPTHILNGVENDRMNETIQQFSQQFETIAVGAPLLSDDADLQAAVEAMAQQFGNLEPNQALILMGHGTDHHANTVYAAMDYRFQDLGYSNIFVATVEAYPMLENAIRRIRNLPQVQQVVLTPFMIVAGDHAKNDMAGPEADSWKNILQREGYQTQCVVRGLGEYDAIIDMLVQHARQAEKEKAQ